MSMTEEIVGILVAGDVGEAEARADAARIEAAANGDSDKARELANARANGQPIAYVLGLESFMGVELEAAPGALVPREETEILGQRALSVIRAIAEEKGSVRVIDMCAGSGNLGCAIGAAVPEARIWMSDLTDETVALARRNVERLALGDRVEVAQGDLFAGLEGKGLEGTIDVVICNPPYISSGKLEGDRKELLDSEPREAFDGGPYGIAIHQRVIKDALAYLEDDGWLMFEFGLGQDWQLGLLFKRSKAYGPVEFENDADGNPRAAFAQKKSG